LGVGTGLGHSGILVEEVNGRWENLSVLSFPGVMPNPGESGYARLFFKNPYKSWIYYGRYNPALSTLRQYFVGIGQVPDIKDVVEGRNFAASVYSSGIMDF
jgi:hypothetical protein